MEVSSGGVNIHVPVPSSDAYAYTEDKCPKVLPGDLCVPVLWLCEGAPGVIAPAPELSRELHPVLVLVSCSLGSWASKLAPTSRDPLS